MVEGTVRDGQNGDRLAIFISYSRHDLAVADTIVSALEGHGFSVLIDRRDLPYGEEWQAELSDFIRTSDTVLWLISPESLKSKWCNWELGEVERTNKRLVPVRIRDFATESLPEALGKIHILPSASVFGLDEHLPALIEVLNTDRAWVKEATRLYDRALEWTANQRKNAMLLRGAALKSAEGWLRNRPRSAKEPASEVLQLLLASRRSQTQRLRWTVAGLGAGLIMALILSGLAVWQQQVATIAKYEAQSQRDTARHNQSAALAAQAASSIPANPARAVKLALAAWPRNLKDQTPRVDAAMTALSAAVTELGERKILRGHTGEVSGAVFSRSGTRIVTASDDNTARIWDAGTGQELAVLRGHEEGVNKALFSPDGTRIVTTSLDKTARVWDTETGKQIAVLHHIGSVVDADFSPDGKRIVTASFDLRLPPPFGEKFARVWDVGTGDLAVVLSGHQDIVIRAAYSPDGKRIITGSADNTARIWDAATGKEIAVLPDTAFVWTVGFSPDGKRIVTVSFDIPDTPGKSNARIWDATTGKALAVLRGRRGHVTHAAFSPDGTHIVTASTDNTVQVWDVMSGKEIAVILGTDTGVGSVEFSPDGNRVVAWLGDHTARVWDAATGEEIAVLRGTDAAINSAVFSPDGTHVLTASNTAAQLWDITTGTQTDILRGNFMMLGVAFARDGSHVVTVPEEESSRAGLWEVAVGKPIKFLRWFDGAMTAAFSPDGKRVVTGSDGTTAAVVDAETGNHLLILRGHKDRVASAAFSRDGTRIVTASFDNTARLWDAETGRSLVVFSGHSGRVWSAAFSTDGDRIVTASDDKTARLWEVSTGRQIALLRGHDGFVRSAAFSPDGKRIATASDDKTVRVWDAATEKPIAILRGHDAEVRGVAFSPDGERIVSGSWDLTARLWDIASGKAIVILRDRNSVNGVAFSPDGTRIATASDDGVARMWSVGAFPKGNIFHIACAWLPDHDLTGIARDYGLTNLEPICEGNPPLPDPPLPPTAK